MKAFTTLLILSLSFFTSYKVTKAAPIPSMRGLEAGDFQRRVNEYKAVSGLGADIIQHKTWQPRAALAFARDDGVSAFDVVQEAASEITSTDPSVALASDVDPPTTLNSSVSGIAAAGSSGLIGGTAASNMENTLDSVTSRLNRRADGIDLSDSSVSTLLEDVVPDNLAEIIPQV